MGRGYPTNRNANTRRLFIITGIILGVCLCLIAYNHYRTTKLDKENTVDLSDIEQMNIGAEMPRLLYGDNEEVIMQGTFGLLVYSIKDSSVTNRIPYDQIAQLGVSVLNASVSHDGKIIYIGNMDFTSSQLSILYQYEIKSNAIEKVSQLPANVFTPIDISAGYDEQYDKYFDFHYLINNTIIEVDDSFMYLRANTDWSMKSLQLVICQYADGVSTVYDVF